MNVDQSKTNVEGRSQRIYGPQDPVRHHHFRSVESHLDAPASACDGAAT